MLLMVRIIFNLAKENTIPSMFTEILSLLDTEHMTG